MGTGSPYYTITLIALYSGAFLSEEILEEEPIHSEIQNQEKRYITLVENMTTV
jgi:hypothetical protein